MQKIIKGVAGRELSIDNDRIRIETKGLLASMMRDNAVDFFLKDIKSMELSPKQTIVERPFISFHVDGATPVKQGKVIHNDKYHFVVDKKQSGEIVELHEYIVGFLRDKDENDAAPKAQQADDIPAQLQKLASLKDAGILTEEEFAAKKAELLAKM